jgi:hypothetical protein
MGEDRAVAVTPQFVVWTKSTPLSAKDPACRGLRPRYGTLRDVKVFWFFFSKKNILALPFS